MWNYHGCKGKARNLIPHYLIDIIHKTIKPSHLEKLQIIQNINKIMFLVIFIFSDWIFWLKFPPPVLSWGKQIFRKFCLEFWVGNWAWVKMNIFNTFYGNVNTLNWNIFPTHGGTYNKIRRAFWREMKT